MCQIKTFSSPRLEGIRACVCSFECYRIIYSGGVRREGRFTQRPRRRFGMAVKHQHHHSLEKHLGSLLLGSPPQARQCSAIGGGHGGGSIQLKVNRRDHKQVHLARTTSCCYFLFCLMEIAEGAFGAHSARTPFSGTISAFIVQG